MVQHVKEFSTERNTAIRKRKAEARQCQKIEHNLSFCSGKFGIRRNFQEREENRNRTWSQLCHANHKRAQETQPSTLQKSLHMSKNTMSIGGKQLHATTNFMRQFTSVKAKVANHKDAAFKKAENKSSSTENSGRKKLLTKSWTKLKKQPNTVRIYSNKQEGVCGTNTKRGEYCSCCYAYGHMKC